MNNLNDIFDDVNLEGIVDAEEIVNIDIDGIDDNSIIDAKAMVENLSKFYYDEEFMRANPSLKKRIDSELESLRILIKMRRSDETTHDILLGAIAKNSSNASLLETFMLNFRILMLRLYSNFLRDSLLHSLRSFP